MRPQLTSQQAAEYTRNKVLSLIGPAGAERYDPWSPSLADWCAAQPDYLVDASLTQPGAGRFRGIQDAINQVVRDAPNLPAGRRVIIKIAPGRYDHPLYVPPLANGVSLRLIGSAAPSDTVICANIDAEMPGAEYGLRFAALFADAPSAVRDIVLHIAAQPKITTANASVLRIQADGCQLCNLTIQNTYAADRLSDGASDRAGFALATGQHQAVALLINGADRTHVRQAHLKSFQDTVYLKSPARFQTTRSLFEACEIEGDVDFIFGPATGYFQGCTIRSIGARAPQSWVTAPSTNLRTSYGFVFEDCDFLHDHSENARAGRMSLGRQWFEAVRATPYGEAPPDYTCHLAEASSYAPPNGQISRATLEAVGKCVILNSRIGAHINPSAPWDDWNGGRFLRGGCYVPSPWKPRFRPVQTCFADMVEGLKDWADVIKLVWDIPPDTVFLGEFNNCSIPDP